MHKIYHMASFSRSGETLVLRCLHAHPDIHVVHQIHRYDSPEDFNLFKFLTNYKSYEISNNNPYIKAANVPKGKVLVLKSAVWLHQYPFFGFILSRNPFSTINSFLKQQPKVVVAIDRMIEEDRNNFTEDDCLTNENLAFVDRMKSKFKRWAQGIDRTLVGNMERDNIVLSLCELYNAKMKSYFYEGLPIIRYEDFVKKPEKELQRILQYMKLPWNEQVLESHKLYKKNEIGHGGIKLWEPIHEGSINTYKKIPKNIKKLIHTQTYHTMLIYGYLYTEKEDELIINQNVKEYKNKKTIKKDNKNHQKPEPYQDNDREIIHYNYYLLESTGVKFRGPHPKLQGYRKTFSALGAAQTFGRFCYLPYPNILSILIQKNVLNLGYAGAGPSFYLHTPNIFSEINSTDFVVLQVMSARSVENKIYKNISGRNILEHRETGQRLLDDKAYSKLLSDYSHVSIKSIIEETQENWIKEMQFLLSKINKPICLLWFSTRFPEDYHMGFGNHKELLGDFPHMVTRNMVDTLKEKCDIYVECVVSRGLPQQLYDKSGNIVQIPFSKTRFSSKNKYYPSPEMHHDAAHMLYNSLKKDGRFVQGYEL